MTYSVPYSYVLRVVWCLAIALLCGTAHAQVVTDSTGTAGEVAAEEGGADAAVVLSPVGVEVVTIPDDPRTPRGALLRSLAVPGWGQVYNGQWGKAPIAFGAVAGVTVLVVVNHLDYRQWREAYLFSACEDLVCDPDQPGVNPNAGFLDTWQALGEPSTQLALNNRDVLRRNRDFAILIGILVYGLQALDSYVSGHLLDFDVSEDLSLRALPALTPHGTVGGRLALRWRW
ncbi:MAG: DUF5683 domain-containing protein [Bacteroidota bacterium]